ncbi:MAG: hypothetical protein AMJ65_12680 [Phycisphaerae bacterium SG8_4]|nr:MAG: hypothetical protein AMJ65_12680 [Phycisphaerae bacterium SG8_4]
MKVKLAFSAVLVVFLVLVTDSSVMAADTRAIDTVLKKTVLETQDFKVIDDFLAEAVQELVRERDFTTIARNRSVIISRKGEQPQYVQQFLQSALKHIQAGFGRAEQLSPEQRKTNVVVNLLILIDGLEDLALADMALARFKDENAVVRYWAVHCLSSPAIVQQLNAGAASNPGPAASIATQLKDIVDSSSVETLALIAGFGATIDIPQGEELLLQVADARIKRYADWTVKHELSEIALLKLLESKLPLSSQGPGGAVPAGLGKPAIAQRFAQLYSYAIQRYLKGQGVLNDTQKDHLASVLVEVQEKCVSRLLGTPQTTFRRAIERANLAAIVDEHNGLLGNGTTAGQLPSKLGFDYGTDSAGAKRMAPIPLSDPVAK